MDHGKTAMKENPSFYWFNILLSLPVQEFIEFEFLTLNSSRYIIPCNTYCFYKGNGSNIGLYLQI